MGKKILVIFLSIFILQSAMQFVAWAVAERSGVGTLFWKIFSAPLFYVLPSFANEYFWVVSILNSVVWAVILTLLASRLSPKTFKAART